MNWFLSLYCAFIFQLNPSEVKVSDFVEQFSYEKKVNDYADLFTEEEELKLTKKLKQIKKENNISYIVVSVDSLEGNQVFRVASAMLENWKLSVNSERHSPSDAGILFLFSKDDYIAYIATSRETDEYLPHKKIKEIIEIDVVPSLRHGNYFEGTVNGIDALHQYLGQTFQFSKKEKSNFSVYLLGIIALAAVIFSIRYFKNKSSLG